MRWKQMFIGHLLHAGHNAKCFTQIIIRILCNDVIISPLLNEEYIAYHFHLFKDTLIRKSQAEIELWNLTPKALPIIFS